VNRGLRRGLFVFALVVLALVPPSHAQFGKNKVQYQKFDWRQIRTTHFDIYFSQGGDLPARRAADSMESYYSRIVERTGMRLEERVPLLIYNSHPKFQQTNVIDEILGEGVGGFTEIFKNRIVVPFDGSYRRFDHVLAHELVHAVMFEALRQDAGSRIAGAIQMRMPLWFSEGIAEYVSLDWDRPSEMWMMDAVTAGYLPMPTGEIQGFLAYRAGQNFMFYLDRTFGPGTVKKVIQRTLRDRDLERAVLAVTRVSLRDLGEEWIRELRWAYWPELGKREHGSKAGRKLTRAGEDGSYWNMQPSVSPDGERIAWFSDRGTRQGLYVGEIGSLPRKEPRQVHQGGGTSSHESFSPFRSGLSWSPDGRRIAVAALRGGRNVLSIVDARSGRARRTVDPGMDALSNPDWSFDGNCLVFRGVRNGQADLWIYDLAKDSLGRLTDDLADDDEPAFSPSGRYVAWSTESDGRDGIAERATLWMLDRHTGERRRISSSAGDETRPSFGGASDDSSTLVFLSDRSGLPQVYAMERPFSPNPAVRPLTNLLAGVQCPRISRDGDKVALSLFEGGSFDLYVVDAGRRLTDSVIALTRFMETSSSGEPRLFRPLVRENMESFRFDTLERKDSLRRLRDSTERLRKDSLKADKPPADRPIERDSRLFGFDRDEPAALGRETPPVRDTTEVGDTLALFPADLPKRDSLGMPLVEPYRTRWGLDNAALAFGFSTYSGTAGQGMFTFSDLMGDQVVQAMLNIQGSFDDANVYLRYGYLPHQTDLFLTGYHTRTFTGNLLAVSDSLKSSLFADRLYGFEVGVLHPFSMFHRAGVALDVGGIQRKPQAWDEDGYIVDAPAGTPGGEDLAWIRANAEWVFDNVIWGPTGPWDGWRAKLSAAAMPPWIQEKYAFGKAKADMRLYLPTGRLFGFALRLSGGRSFALGGDENPARFLVGGEHFTFNYHINEANSGIDVSAMYFSELDLPLRGYRYYQFRGDKEILGNIEFRFPFVEELRFGIFLPTIRYLMGAVFVDAGTAWTSHRVVDQGGVGMGYGVRMNLGAFVLKWSKAWPLTQPAGAEGNPQPRNFVGGVHYWSLGAEF
jgi:Tol biopolymer transport system component